MSFSGSLAELEEVIETAVRLGTPRKDVLILLDKTEWNAVCREINNLIGPSPTKMDLVEFEHMGATIQLEDDHFGVSSDETLNTDTLFKDMLSAITNYLNAVSKAA